MRHITLSCKFIFYETFKNPFFKAEKKDVCFINKKIECCFLISDESLQNTCCSAKPGVHSTSTVLKFVDEGKELSSE